MNSLLVFSIGPVQSFIASARKLEDLWSGSYLLSYLTETAIKEFFKYAELERIHMEMIYPALDPTNFHNVNSNTIAIASLPNRFVCQFEASEEKVAGLAKKAEARVRKEFYLLCKDAVDHWVFSHSDVKKDWMYQVMKQQINSFLELFWTIEPLYDTYENSRYRLEKRLAALKNNRMFVQKEQIGLVCTVCGEQAALTEFPYKENGSIREYKQQVKTTWGKRSSRYQEDDSGGRIKDNEALCSICLGKRIARDYFIKLRNDKNFPKFPSTTDIAKQDSKDGAYYAILMMDGDDMGQWFSGKKGSFSKITIETHQKISKRLEVFSKQTVPELVKKYETTLIYAGGDDVLAFAPLKHALELAKKLREAFQDDQKGLGKSATSSMGMVIVHHLTPLNAALDYVRKLESRAKSYTHPFTNKQKDCLAISVLTRSGEIREVPVPWYIDELQQESTVDLLIDIKNAFVKQHSLTFLYTFAQEFLPLLGADHRKKLQVDPELISCELERLYRRSLQVNQSDKEIKQKIDSFVRLHDVVPSTLQFIHLLEILQFFHRTEKRNERREIV